MGREQRISMAKDHEHSSARPPLRAALIGMPWFWAHMPSIQLAIVKDLLGSCGVEADVYEFYADFAERFGIDLYGKLANTGTYVAERLFSQFYFDALRSEPLSAVPPLAFDSPEIEKYILQFGTPIAEQFLQDCMIEADWSKYDMICFTLTAQQMGATIAFARLVKQQHPDVKILIGGAGCAGSMGRALLEMCAEFDIAVHGEAETTVPALVDALKGDRPLTSVGAISWRDSSGEVRSNDAIPMHNFVHSRAPLDFNSYFKRIQNLPSLSSVPSWIPFESSRGCWYGEKSQCTFCGLNEIIKFRQRPTDQIFSELEQYEDAYGKSSFFSVDLIMPRTFLKDFVPRMEGAAKDWKIFYEVKSNMRRPEVIALAAAGVDWIQPGIESLSDHVLKLMKKGVSGAQNVQCLRLARENGIAVSWNIISNFPQESAEDYSMMAAMIPHLYHLDPPSGIAPFEVHRFSPFHKQPHEHGIRLGGPHHRYRSVFPIADALLGEIVYRFEYDLLQPKDEGLVEAHRTVGKAVNGWKQARERECIFQVEYRADGTAILRDNRRSHDVLETVLQPHEASLLDFLEELRPQVRLLQQFAASKPLALAAFGGEDQFQDIIDNWCEAGIVLCASNTVQSLATRIRAAPAAAPMTLDPELVSAE
jgi:ribosomal peptide maturation radical SAM protein 1